MSKKAIVNEIKSKIGNHRNLNIELPNGDKLSWVSSTQVMISVKIDGSLFRNKRYPLYSKEVDINMLNLINSNL